MILQQNVQQPIRETELQKVATKFECQSFISDLSNVQLALDLTKLLNASKTYDNLLETKMKQTSVMLEDDSTDEEQMQYQPSQQSIQQVSFNGNTTFNFTQMQQINDIQSEAQLQISDDYQDDYQQEKQKKLCHSITPLIVKVKFTQDGIRKVGTIKLTLQSDTYIKAKQFCQAFGLNNQYIQKVEKLLQEKKKQFGYEENIEEQQDIYKIQQNKPIFCKAVLNIMFGLRQKQYNVISGEEEKLCKQIIEDFCLDFDTYEEYIMTQIKNI